MSFLSSLSPHKKKNGCCPRNKKGNERAATNTKKEKGTGAFNEEGGKGREREREKKMAIIIIGQKKKNQDEGAGIKYTKINSAWELL